MCPETGACIREIESRRFAKLLETGGKTLEEVDLIFIDEEDAVEQNTTLTPESERQSNENIGKEDAADYVEKV